MTITQLKYLIAVAEFNNFTMAAEKNFVTQPTLSMQIQKLEDELGIRIFERTRKSVKITDVGEKILIQAKKIVHEANKMQDVVEQYKGFIGGELRLGMIPTVMPTLLPMFLNNFLKKYPQVELVIEELTTENIINRLKNGSLDCAIAATPLYDQKIKEYPLYYEPLMAYVPNNLKLKEKPLLAVEDLDTNQLLLLEDGHCFSNNVLNMCKKSRHHEELQIKSGSFETLIKLADEGLGFTIIPYLHTLNLNEASKQHIKYFESPNPAREVSLIAPENALKSHVIEALKELIKSVIRGAIKFQDVNIMSPLPKS